MNRIDVEHVCISRSNIKMGNIPSVSLPPVVSCNPKACKFCAKKCYARKISKLRPSVKQSYERNLKILLEEPKKYWREVNAQVALTTYFRFHVAGDIYDIFYLMNMVEVARNNPHCQILCFTKQYSSVNTYLQIHKYFPENLHIIFSIWRGLDCENPFNLPEAHVFYKDGFTTASDGAKYCSGNCTDCAIEGKNCWTLQKGEQIIFKEH